MCGCYVFYYSRSAASHARAAIVGQKRFGRCCYTRSTLPTVTHDKIVDDCNIRSGSPKRLDLFLASFSYYACFRHKCCNCQLATGDVVVRYKYAIGVAFESFQSAHAGYTVTRHRRSCFLRPNVVHAEMCRISDRAVVVKWGAR